MVKIKICGLRRIEDINYVNQFLPEYIGFLFAKGRERTVSYREAALLRARLDNRITPVGVFLNQPQDDIAEGIRAGIFSVIQLHGQEDNIYIEELREKVKDYGAPPIIKACSVSSKEDVEHAKKSAADMILLDNKFPGSGKRFDWSLLCGAGRPFFLAGGLDADNVTEALKRKPYAVDVSSGVETDKKKDVEKIKTFIRKVRTYNNE